MGGVVSALLKDVYLPRMVKIHQNFDASKIAKEDIPGVIFKELGAPKFDGTIKPGMRIAITCGSRGVANIVVITKAVADYVKSCGGQPFVVPAMGSHGGATDEGQRELLAGYGVTEETVGCPIISSMKTKLIGYTEEGHKVLIDKNAAEADGIIVVGRVKPHTSFRGPFESGIMKMMTIGLGKQEGAEVCHEAGFKHMGHLVPLFGKAILKYSPVISALAIIENAYDTTCKLVGLLPDEIETEEPKLLTEAKSRMARILIPETDVLVVDKIGKDMSGDGMDPNISGTFATPYASGGLKSQNVAVLDLTDATHGSAVGVGAAHATTLRLFNKMKWEMTYPNAITSTVLSTVRIPAVMDSDKEAIQICVRTCNEIDKSNPRIIRIPNTMHVGDILISEAHLEEAKANPNIEILGEPEYMNFDENGNLW